MKIFVPLIKISNRHIIGILPPAFITIDKFYLKENADKIRSAYKLAKSLGHDEIIIDVEEYNYPDAAVVAEGNLSEGFKIYGPFSSIDDGELVIEDSSCTWYMRTSEINYPDGISVDDMNKIIKAIIKNES